MLVSASVFLTVKLEVDLAVTIGTDKASFAPDVPLIQNCKFNKALGKVNPNVGEADAPALIVDP